MKHTDLLVPALLALGALNCAPRSAQAQLALRGKLGAYLPRDRDTSRTAFLGEADAILPNFGAGRYVVSAGYIQGGGLRIVPLTIGRYFSPPNPLGSITGNVYAGVGLGPYFVRASSNGDSQSKTTLGGYAVVGYQLPNPYFVEAKYHLVGKVGGVRPSGLALAVGRRF